jgi:hypothetical protein
MLQKHRANSDPDHMNLGPIGIVSPPIELAARKFADRDDERCLMNLLAKA